MPEGEGVAAGPWQDTVACEDDADHSVDCAIGEAVDPIPSGEVYEASHVERARLLSGAEA